MKNAPAFLCFLAVCLAVAAPLRAQDGSKKASSPDVPPKAATAKPAKEGISNSSAPADAQVQGLLFFAANDATTPTQEEKIIIDPTLLNSVESRLKKVFPYSNYHLIGKHTQKVFKEYESWVVPSKDLCLKIDSRGPAGEGGVNVHLQLWQDTKVLVKSDAVIRPGKPIFLGGPNWRGGRLIFVVMLKQ